MKLLLAALPGVVGLVVAVVALARSDVDPPPRATPVTPVAPQAALPSLSDLYSRVDGVVARLDARRGPGDPPFGNGRRDAIGAAFVIDSRGHMVTNAHVVDRARSATVRFGRSAARIPARIVGLDRSTDLAVLRIDPDRLGDDAPLELAPEDSIRVGDAVLAVGTPYRLQSSASAGIVSALGREIEGLSGFSVPDAIQTDAAVNPGNSGGPLIDSAGRVVGVNTQGRADGISFAVSAATVRRVVPQLIADGRARTAYLGVSVRDVSERGSRLRSVAVGSPGARTGLREGDVVVSIGGRATTTEGSVASAIARRRPGQRVQIRFRRDGRERTLTARLGTQPQPQPQP
jgi:S1-C subfamily serine protease